MLRCGWMQVAKRGHMKLLYDLISRGAPSRSCMPGLA